MFSSHPNCDYVSFDNWAAYFNRERLRTLTLTPVVSSAVLAQQDLDNSGVAEAFEAMHGIDLIGPEGSRMRAALSTTTAVRESHNLLMDVVMHSQPASVIAVLRERLQAVCTQLRLVLPEDMSLYPE
ncbi:hypothetical protein B0H10DRAFT_1957560 [Mycena sp. CBHHK59/15]|nr:hypothetical protein B0H10DRAFT_1965137 [Mycena sp. CBHHK59/15]KAJ6603985.1 hypothetical protein B0H10DRAFT_1957560 [Mycena sp. CBHHK59/15]